MATLRILLAVSGLTCGDAPRLERALRQTEGTLRVSVNPLTEMAFIEYDGDLVSPQQLAGVAHRAGFELVDARRR